MTSRAQNRREHEAGLSAYQRSRARQEADSKPRIYVTINADTGEATAHPERSRDPQAAIAHAARVNAERGIER